MSTTPIDLSATKAAFPDRPLQITAKTTGRKGWTSAILFWLVGAGIFALCYMAWLPDLVNDFRLRDTAEVVRDPRSRVTGKCRSQLFIQTCEADLSYRRNGKTYTYNIAYLMLGVGDHNVVVMADPQNPDQMTTDLGLDQFWNRMLVFLGLVAAGVACGAAGIVGVRTCRREGAIVSALTNRRLYPVLIPVVSGTGRTKPIKTVNADGSAQKWEFAENDKPLLLYGDAYVLGVSANSDGNGPVFPMDETLARLKLEKDERETLLKAVYSE